MKIRNFCFTLKNNNIKYYLSQLPDIYRTCEVPIVFIPDNYLGYLIFLFYAWKYNLYERSYKDFKDYLGVAWISSNDCEPVLIHCRYKNKLTLVDTLFHELRHWFQAKYMKQFYINGNSDADYNLDSKEYNNLPLEKDANTFAKKYSKKLGIKYAVVQGELWIIQRRSKLKDSK